MNLVDRRVVYARFRVINARLRVVDPRTVAALVAFAVTLVVHAVNIPSQGLTDDDDFYAPAGIRYVEWLGDVFTAPSSAFSHAGVDAAFKANHEHPPLAKLVFGVTHAVAQHLPGLGDLDAARLGCALFASLLSALLVLLLWTPLGKTQAIAAPILLLSLPRFLFHSEVATLDVPVACAVFAVTAAYFWSESATGPRAVRASLACSAVFGLACLVKLNAPFAIIPCAFWSLCACWRGFRVVDGALEFPPIPRALPLMIIAGPLFFVALWPWLWFDTVARIGAYIAFHLNHYPIYLFYDGVIWEKPFAPWHAVPVLGFGAMPVTVVALGVLGGIRAARGVVRMVRDRAGTGDKLRALLFLQALFSMAVVANPTTPRYGGEKLFMPFFPLFCALAADGAALIVDALAVVAPRLRPALLRDPALDVAAGGGGAVRGHVGLVAVAVVVVALAALPGFVGTARFHGGYALSYYGETVGGLRGAVSRGFERTYYDVADKPLARWLDENAHGSHVHFEPNHKEYARTYRWLARDGYISRALVLDDRDAALEVLTHERRWSTYPALKTRLEAKRPLYEKSIDGVPLYTVYASSP